MATEYTVNKEDIPTRIDVWLTNQLPDLSRSRIQELIKSEYILINGKNCKPNTKLTTGDTISVEIPPAEPIDITPEDIPLNVIYEDSDIIVINKPAGLVTHPAPGNYTGTLVNALLHHCKDLQGIGGELRPGIVHRLDKDTSGLLVIAKNEQAMGSLVHQFKEREVKKIYVALVWGHPHPEAETIKTLIGRSPHDRKKMTARPKSGRDAITHYTTITQFENTSFLRIHIETGRTHQIRVHMTHIGHPIVGDQQYGRARKQALPLTITHQMLHAEQITFTHPTTGEPLEFKAPLPDDFRALLQALSTGNE